MKITKYFINAIHKSCGTFNEFTFDLKVAKSIACDFIKSGYYDYVGISIEYFDKYYANCLKKRHTRGVKS